jgi:predicted NACHT family NTPase
MLPLRNFSRRSIADGKPTPKALVELIQENLSMWGIAQSAIQLVLRYLERGQCLLLLDGLDEVPVDLRYSVAESINAFAARYSSNIFFVTMRTHAYEQGVQLNGFEPFQILPWNEEQAVQFIKNWYSESPENAEKLLKVLSSNKNVASFVGHPILLTILVSTFDSYGRLPEKRGDLVASFVDVALGRWDQARGIDLGEGYSTSQFKQALTAIAEQMQINNGNIVQRSNAVDIIAKTIGLAPNEATKLLEALVARSGILIEAEHNKFMFVHQIVQEYFATLAIIDHDIK